MQTMSPGEHGVTDAGQWSKEVSSFAARGESVTVHFVDGSSAAGRLLVACDGGNSRIRRVLFPDQPSYKIPIRVIGVKTKYTPEQMEPLRKLDPIFLQGTSSANDTYSFVSSKYHASAPR